MMENLFDFFACVTFQVEFIPKDGKTIRWYMCGPTVYSHSHLGHARTYLGFDIIKKILRDYFKYDVIVRVFCFMILIFGQMNMNITDIEDKIIIRSKEAGIEFSAFARKWENDYFDDMKSLNIELPEIMTRVSEYVPEIIIFIAKLIDNGFAYEANSSIYFDVKAYTDAGF